jgi:ribosome-associated protein
MDEVLPPTIQMPAKKKAAPPAKSAQPATRTRVAKPRTAKPKAAGPATPPTQQALEQKPSGPPEGLALAQCAAHYADDKKAEDILILDVRGICMITDFFLICTGTSMPHLRAIRREIADRLWEDHHVKARTLDGQPESSWVVVDFGDVIVHIFLDEKRRHYDLEGYWSDAPRLEFSARQPAVRH